MNLLKGNTTLSHFFNKSSRKAIVWFAVLLIGYALIAIIFTYPLIGNISTHITGDGNDGPIFIWNAWWFGQSVDTHSSLFYTNYILYPKGADLLFHTHTLVHDFLIFLIEPLFGLIAAFNIIFLFSLVFAALGTYLLAVTITKNRIAASIAGLIFVFSPAVMVRALGHFNLTAIWPIPWFFYFFIVTIMRRKIWPAAGAGFILGLSVLNDFYYPFFIIIAAIITIFIYAASSPKIFFSLRTFLLMAVLGLVALAVASPILLTFLQRHELPIRPPLSDYQGFSADLIRYVIPSFQNHWLGEIAYRVEGNFSQFGGGIENTVYFGFTVIALAALALILVRSKLQKIQSNKIFFLHPFFWLLIALTGIILSLGPTLTVNGQQHFSIYNHSFSIPLPYRLLWHVPLAGAIRVPSRFSILGIFGFAVLAAMTISWLWQKFSARKIGKISLYVLSSFMPLLIIFEYLPTPYPLNDLTLPPEYLSENVKGDGAILDLPFGIRDGFRQEGKFQAMQQFAQTSHQRPIIGGYISRIHPEQFDRLKNEPGISFLLNFPTKKGTSQDFIPAKVQQVLLDYNVRTIILHSDQYQQVNEFVPILHAYIERVMGGRSIEQRATYEIFNINPNTFLAAQTDIVKDLVIPPVTTLPIGETIENGLLPKRFTNAIMATAGTTVGIIHLDAFKDGIPEGPVDIYDFVRAYPWADMVTVATMSCADLNKITQSELFSVSNTIGNCPVGGLMTVALPGFLVNHRQYLFNAQLINITELPITVVQSVIKAAQTTNSASIDTISTAYFNSLAMDFPPFTPNKKPESK